MPTITLLTDFGTADGYVGEMKGVLCTRAPAATIIDVTHDNAHGDIEAARLAVARYWRRFPEGTIHLAVVDPGVGSERRALAVHCAGRWLVGPDNGVLSPALLVPGARAVSLRTTPDAAATFHGRDLFAPAAAALATDTSLDDLGEPCDDPVVRRTPDAHRVDARTVVGCVISVDRFGNLITNLVPPRYPAAVMAGGRRIGIARVYSDVEPSTLVALAGSNGLLEIAVRDGSAALTLGLRRGAEIRVERQGA